MGSQAASTASHSTVDWPAMLAAGHMQNFHTHTDRCVRHTQSHMALETVDTAVRPEAVQTGAKAFG